MAQNAKKCYPQIFCSDRFVRLINYRYICRSRLNGVMYKYKVMVVDDEESLCEILKFNLEKEGYEVLTASSAEEVLTMDLRGLDLMILDIMMPRLDGIKTGIFAAINAEKDKLIATLTTEMREAAKMLEFEHAAYLRDKIEKLRRGK